MDQKPTYEELEEKYKNLVENIADVIFEISDEGYLTYVSPNIKNVLFYTSEEKINTHFKEFVYPKDVKKAIEGLEYQKKGRKTPIEFRMMNKRGEIVWISLLGRLVRDKDKNVFRGVLRDISKKMETEEALRESKENYQELAESISDVFFAMDNNLRYTYWNKASEILTGIPAERAIGRSLREIMPDNEARKRVEEMSLRVMETRKPEQLIVQYPGNEHIHHEINAYPASGGVTIFVKDITERKKMEDALRESQERYRALFTNNPTDIIVVDNDAKIMMYNLVNEKSAGRSPNIGDVMYKDYAAKHEINMFEELMGCIKSGDQKEFAELKYKEQFLHIRISPFSGGAIITSIDITESKIQESERLKMEKLESLGILAGGIAHDFNNILTTILGNVSIARDHIDPKSEIKELLSEAGSASRRAQTLTKQLLTFAKGGAPVKETASVGDIIKESSLFVMSGSKSGCEFSIAEDLWPVEVDVGQISQVINNIVINANQAMPLGGIIEIKAENRILDKGNEWQLKPGRYIRISIKDEGIGIAEKQLLKIFDPYFTTKQEGSGLGLATSYSIIKMHGGIIIAESLLGSGSTFHIYLPASSKTVPRKEESQVIKGQGNILVMDDEPSLRKIVGRMLEILGYDSEFAKDGREAIDMYTKAKEAKRPYDAVILDLTVPGGMGGKEAIQKLLEIDPTIKAIVSSGYSDDQVLANSLDYGFKGKIPKPFESHSLSKELHAVLKGEKS